MFPNLLSPCHPISSPISLFLSLSLLSPSPSVLPQQNQARISKLYFFQCHQILRLLQIIPNEFPVIILRERAVHGSAFEFYLWTHKVIFICVSNLASKQKKIMFVLQYCLERHWIQEVPKKLTTQNFSAIWISNIQ